METVTNAVPDGGSVPLVAERVIQDSVVARISNISEYVTRFKQAFPQEVGQATDIELNHIARAIAAFERELITPNSRYDRFVMGDRDVFNPMETEGFRLFFGKALCGDCHHGAMLSDYTFRVQGVADQYESIIPGFDGKNGLGGDWGRYHADDLAFADQRFAFRVPTIRNVELTAPYFHSGSAGTLRDVVGFYNSPTDAPMGFPDDMLAAQGAVRDPSIRKLNLSEDEIDAIIAFMRTTTAPVQMGPLGLKLTEVPPRVPSGLVPPGIPTPEGPGPFYPPVVPDID